MYHDGQFARSSVYLDFIQQNAIYANLIVAWGLRIRIWGLKKEKSDPHQNYRRSDGSSFAKGRFRSFFRGWIGIRVFRSYDPDLVFPKGSGSGFNMNPQNFLLIGVEYVSKNIFEQYFFQQF